MKFVFDLLKRFHRRKCLNSVDGRTADDDDGRTPRFTISSPCEPDGSDELRMYMHILAYVSLRRNLTGIQI